METKPIKLTPKQEEVILGLQNKSLEATRFIKSSTIKALKKYGLIYGVIENQQVIGYDLTKAGKDFKIVSNT